MHLPTINCWYASRLEEASSAAAPAVAVKSEAAAAHMDPIQPSFEVNDLFASDPSTISLGSIGSLSSIMQRSSGMLPGGALPDTDLFSGWLTPPDSFSWCTARLASEDNLRQPPDVLFRSQDPSLSSAPVGSASSLCHWVRPAMLAAVSVSHSGKLTFWWAKMGR